MTPLIARRPVAAAIATRLTAVTNAVGYVGQIAALNGLPAYLGQTDTTPEKPPAKSPTDPRVVPYFVFYPGIGGPTDETDLGDTSVDIDYSCAVTAAAGDVDDLLALVDRITAALWRWAPADLPPVGGRRLVAGPLRFPPGFVPQLLVDTQFAPVRHYARLEFVTTVHT